MKLDPKAFWTAHQQAQILVKQGKKAEAIAAAQRSLAIAAAHGARLVAVTSDKERIPEHLPAAWIGVNHQEISIHLLKKQRF